MALKSQPFWGSEGQKVDSQPFWGSKCQKVDSQPHSAKKSPKVDCFPLPIWHVFAKIPPSPKFDEESEYGVTFPEKLVESGRKKSFVFKIGIVKISSIWNSKILRSFREISK